MRYFIYEDNRQQGPYTAEELRQRGLSSETLVSAEGTGPWTPAWQICELKDSMDNRKTEPPVPSPQEDVRAEAVDGSADGKSAVRSGRGVRLRGRVAVLVLLAMLFAVLSVTCPDKDSHKAAVSGEISRAACKISDMADPWGLFGSVLSSGIVNMAVDQLLEVDNYIVFSIGIGTVHYGGRSRAVSFGILNHVFTFDAGYLEQSLKEDRVF